MIKENIIFSNPFFEAYIHSDFLGKLIFISLIIISIISWIILLYKIWLTYQARKSSLQFQNKFYQKRFTPLQIELEQGKETQPLNPFKNIYQVLKKYTIELLNKNQHFNKNSAEEGASYLSPSDIDFVQTHLLTEVTSQTKYLESNLFILAMVVTLAPFLGLLGTVWGILTTFSQLQMQSGGNTHSMVLSGLSLALATTVLGLLDAIPALIGYSYLKNAITHFEIDMERFAQEILASVEMQYRKVDLT